MYKCRVMQWMKDDDFELYKSRKIPGVGIFQISKLGSKDYSACLISDLTNNTKEISLNISDESLFEVQMSVKRLFLKSVKDCAEFLKSDSYIAELAADYEDDVEVITLTDTISTEEVCEV